MVRKKTGQEMTDICSIEQKKLMEKNNSYMAGILDGEGCIGIYRCRTGKYFRYQLKVSVKMANYKVISRMKSFYGGSISIPKIIGNRKKQYSWQLSCNKASNFLKKVLPYLIVKDEQASLAINFQENLVSLSNRLKLETPEMKWAKEKITTVFRKLNSRGENK